MKSSTSFCFSSLLFFFIVAASINVVYSEDEYCTCDLTVFTGTVDDAETDSVISVTLSNSAGKRIEILNLMEWRTRSGRYFRSGSRDVFSIRAESADCFDAAAPPCNITVTSDGSVPSDEIGEEPGWFLERVEVDTHKPGVPDQPKVRFGFHQWLANDKPPYKLTASSDLC